MREIGIKAHYIKPYTITTIGQDFSSQLQNLLNRKFNPTKPNAAWCTDITYMDIYGWICLFNKYYGLIFKKNN